MLNQEIKASQALSIEFVKQVFKDRQKIILDVKKLYLITYVYLSKNSIEILNNSSGTSGINSR